MTISRIKLNEMLQQGCSYQEIGNFFGVTRQAVHSIAKRSNIVRLKPKPKKQKKEKPRAWKMFFKTYGCMPQEADHITSDAKFKYRVQKSNARVRGVEWKFNLLTWWLVWETSGFWGNRGVGEAYCMARYMDEGPYSPENVYICTNSKNIKDYHLKKHLHFS